MAMDAEWSEKKNDSNVEKHGISFEDGVKIFEGPTLEREDTRFAYGESRIIAVGAVDGLEICVVYTLRGQTRRLISARRASRGEREAYRQAFSEIDWSG